MQLELAKVYAQGQAKIGRMREATVQLALKLAKAEQKDCITVGGLVAVLIGETARAAGLASMDAATSRADAREAHMAFTNSDASWCTWLKEAVGRRELLVREVATLGPANATPAVRQWTESSAADLPGYVAALVVLKADARRWLEGLGVPLPEFLIDDAKPTPATGTSATARNGMRKNAMVRMLRREWPTIEADLSEASRNGLVAARIKHGMWDVDAAQTWAESQGKRIRRSTPTQATPFDGLGQS